MSLLGGTFFLTGASGIVPSDIPGLAVWYRADSLVTGTTTVTAWGDKSGNGNGLDVNNGTPSLVSGAVNGQPAINFDQAGLDALWRANPISLTFPLHAFMVLRPDAFTAANFFLQLEDGSGGSRPGWRSDGTKIQVRAAQGAGGIPTVDPTSPVSVGNWGLLHSVWPSGAGDMKAAWNNASYATTAVSTLTNADGISLMALEAAGLYADGAVAEFCLYNATEVTGTNLTNLKEYFRSRYNLY